MRKPFYISSNCPKHYYAGTQRVSSKIGTTENVGDYLYDWFTQGTGGPVDVIGSSFGVLENAEEGVIQVYEAFGIDPPTYDSSPVFIPVASFIHGGSEVEQYYFHPDHLGSTSYITNLLGEVSQHMEYFAFGETFVEEHRSSNNSPYKFNGKELDEETGWYYYGARYYDPRISVWLSVDPLASYNPIFEVEHYIDGQHNGGVFNAMNLNVYGYCYQNPVIFVDPNGKQTVAPGIQNSAFIYYVSGIPSHTAIGYYGKHDPNGLNTVMYAPMSGNSSYRETRRGMDGASINGVSESLTIKSYLDMGDKVERYHYKIKDKYLENLATVLEGIIRNPSSEDGLYCTIQTKNALRLAFSISEGDEFADDAVNKIIFSQ